jgi:hypothetical protein
MQTVLGKDSSEYEIIQEAVYKAASVPGMTCELGVREGGCSELIMKSLQSSGQAKTHIGIDPYGNVLYETSEGNVCRHDYTNEMRDRAVIGLYGIAKETNINFLFFNLEDTEFFDRYYDGVPIYQEEKRIETQYSFVHVDAAHSFKSVVDALEFFSERMAPGATIVFDDIGNYDHNTVERDYLFKMGFGLLRKGNVKAAYVKAGWC